MIIYRFVLLDLLEIHKIVTSYFDLCLALPKSATNCENDCNSINPQIEPTPNINLQAPQTKIEASIAGVTDYLLEINLSIKNIWPSVMLITLVVI